MTACSPPGLDAGALYPDGSWCSTQPPGMVLCDDFPGGVNFTPTTGFDVLYDDVVIRQP